MAGNSTANASRSSWGRSGFVGVYKHKRSGKWAWEAQWYGVRIGGYGFYSPEEAAAARLVEIRERWPDHPAAA